MSELRRDPVDGRWVIIASERRKRPVDFHTQEYNGAARSLYDQVARRTSFIKYAR